MKRTICRALYITIFALWLYCCVWYVESMFLMSAGIVITLLAFPVIIMCMHDEKKHDEKKYDEQKSHRLLIASFIIFAIYNIFASIVFPLGLFKTEYEIILPCMFFVIYVFVISILLFRELRVKEHKNTKKNLAVYCSELEIVALNTYFLYISTELKAGKIMCLAGFAINFIPFVINKFLFKLYSCKQ